MENKVIDATHAFLDVINERFQQYCERANLTHCRSDYFAIDSIGRKYIKISHFEKGNDSGRSVHSFVDKKTGDIYKAQTWKAPAKHARGNVFCSRGKDALNSGYLVRYL